MNEFDWLQRVEEGKIIFYDLSHQLLIEFDLRSSTVRDLQKITTTEKTLYDCEEGNGLSLKETFWLNFENIKIDAYCPIKLSTLKSTPPPPIRFFPLPSHILFWWGYLERLFLEVLDHIHIHKCMQSMSLSESPLIILFLSHTHFFCKSCLEHWSKNWNLYSLWSDLICHRAWNEIIVPSYTFYYS